MTTRPMACTPTHFSTFRRAAVTFIGCMSLPKVSIITPSFNQAVFLPETFRSLAKQDYPNIEHIVMDGGSTDGTVELLKATTGIRWDSAKDKRQFDALNKGVA